MHFFDIRLRFGDHTDPDPTPLPGAHSSRSSLTGPDSSPKSRAPLTTPQGRSPALARDDGYDPTDSAAVDKLIDLTERLRLDSLTAAQTLFAPELLEINE